LLKNSPTYLEEFLIFGIALGIAEVLKAEIRLLHVYYSPTIDTAHYSEAYNMHINVEKHWTDVPVSSSAFILSPQP